ncbi:MAG: DUF504 domain-containing protein [Desulfurococcales archaeon]|nr:DUF504 domain-containing protein [Desulfurococcales archaeon]
MKNNTIAGILNKIKWSKEDLRRYAIVVVDRVSPTGLKEIPLSNNVAIKKDRLIINEKVVIPIHRVVAVKRDGEVVWSRKAV